MKRLEGLGAATEGRVSSALARVEVLRAVKKASAGPAVRRRAVRILARVALVQVDELVLVAAARLAPPELRALDAIHLATARSLDDLAGMVTYDTRRGSAGRRRAAASGSGRPPEDPSAGSG